MRQLIPRSIPFVLAAVLSQPAHAAVDPRQLAAEASAGNAVSLSKLQASAGSGNLDAQYWLAMYDLQVRHDDMQAAHWLQYAAKRGSVQSQYGLGLLYTQGRGVPRDYATAAEWYAKAAAHGDLNAANNLGWLYAHGAPSLPKDLAKAAEWYEKAAQAGNVKAQNNLGWLYAKGEGVPRDLVKARHWLQLAAKGGDAEAQRGIDALNAAAPGSVPAPVASAAVLPNPTKPVVAAVRALPTVPTVSEVPAPVMPVSPGAGAGGADAAAQTVQEWARAWSAKDLPAYFAAYVPNYQPSPSVSHAAWVADRTARIAGKAAISVALTNLQSKIVASQAVVSFREDYRSGPVHFNGGKTLVLRQVGGRWLIAQER